MMEKIEYSIIITTNNRLKDLKITLEKITHLLMRSDVECIICDDGSTDDTYEYIKQFYPKIVVIKNTVSKGLIYSRNRLLDIVKGTYAISIDDDLHFITKEPLEKIKKHFLEHEKCAVQSFRIYWGKCEPKSTGTKQQVEKVSSYAGGAHAFRMEAWDSIPNYPDWFMFYGEENFASFQLFKKGWEIHYQPTILTNHRVDLKKRIRGNDYRQRQRRSIRSGWYIFILFYPWRVLPKKILASLWNHFKVKVIEYRSLFFFTVLIQAMIDVVVNLPRLFRESNRLSNNEYKEFGKLQQVKLYWKPKEEVA